MKNKIPGKNFIFRCKIELSLNFHRKAEDNVVCGICRTLPAEQYFGLIGHLVLNVQKSELYKIIFREIILKMMLKFDEIAFLTEKLKIIIPQLYCGVSCNFHNSGKFCTKMIIFREKCHFFIILPPRRNNFNWSFNCSRKFQDPLRSKLNRRS